MSTENGWMPQVWGYDGELIIRFPDVLVLSMCADGECGYAIFDQGKWRPGSHALLSAEAASEIQAVLAALPPPPSTDTVG